MSDALAEYQLRRDEHFLPMYEFNASNASMEPPPPEMLALFEALQHNRVEQERFLGTVAGTVPIPEFYAPENVQRMVAASFGGRTA